MNHGFHPLKSLPNGRRVSNVGLSEVDPGVGGWLPVQDGDVVITA